jgi:hypothetical protein
MFTGIDRSLVNTADLLKAQMCFKFSVTIFQFSLYSVSKNFNPEHNDSSGDGGCIVVVFVVFVGGDCGGKS